MKGLGANEEILRTAFGMVASEIAKYDWPDKWPLLVDQLNEYMHSGQENFVRGAIKCLSLFSDFLDARTLPTIGHKIFPTMNEILSKRDMFGAKLRLQASKVVHSAIVEFLTVKDNENAMYKNFQDMMTQAMPLWINMFLQELDARLCLKFGVEELGIQIQFLRTLKAILKDCSDGILSDSQISTIFLQIQQCFHTYVDLYQKFIVSPEILDRSYPELVSQSSIWSEEAIVHDEDGNEISLQMIVVEIIGLFVDTLYVGEGSIKKIARTIVRQNLSAILRSILCAIFINNTQLLDWEADVETYLMDEDKPDELKRSSSARDEGRSFIETITRLFSSDTVLIELIQNQLPHF